jgi:hypothetical protein
MDITLDPSLIEKHLGQEEYIIIRGCARLVKSDRTFDFLKHDNKDYPAPEFKYSVHYANHTDFTINVIDRNNISVPIRPICRDNVFDIKSKQRLRETQDFMLYTNEENEKINEFIFIPRAPRSDNEVIDYAMHQRKLEDSDGKFFYIFETYEVKSGCGFDLTNDRLDMMIKAAEDVFDNLLLRCRSHLGGKHPVKHWINNLKGLRAVVNDQRKLELVFVTQVHSDEITSISAKNPCGLYLRALDKVLTIRENAEGVVHPGGITTDYLKETQLGLIKNAPTGLFMDLIDDEDAESEAHDNPRYRYFRLFKYPVSKFFKLKARRSKGLDNRNYGNGLYLFHRDENGKESEPIFIPKDKLEEYGVCRNREDTMSDYDNPDFVKTTKNKLDIDLHQRKIAAELEEMRLRSERERDLMMRELEAKNIEHESKMRELARKQALEDRKYKSETISLTTKVVGVVATAVAGLIVLWKKLA